ncbi:MAG: DUF1573 domain-containing protein [Verrucomicrobiota bacterium]|jgi:hypothetical protein
MKSLFRLALILAGTVARPVFLSAQPAAGAPPTPPPAAASASTNDVGPVIQFNTESYDFGKSLLGDPIRYTYLVTNTGDATLEISNVNPSCGCTTVGPPSGGGSWTREIAPHQTGVIPIEVRVAAQGQINKTVTVISNDKKRPNVLLQIHGAVWSPIELSIPTSTLTFNLKADAPAINTQVVKIFNREDPPLTLSAPESSSQFFSAVLRTNYPGREFELTISAAKPSGPPTNGANVQMLRGVITMQTSSARMKVLSITALESIESEILVYPTQLQMPNSPLARSQTNIVTVRANTGAPLTLSNPAVNVPGVEVTVRTLTANKQYSLVVGFPAGFVLPPGQSVVVTVESDNPHFPVIRVPVRPMPAPQPAQRQIIPAPAQNARLNPLRTGPQPVAPRKAPTPQFLAPPRGQSAPLNQPPPGAPGGIIVLTNGAAQPVPPMPPHP